ncbi:M23 family metallopeptidase [Burkholderia sp. Ax-1724]|uniref:M23 family metallopeptidase n=1 Tax=Burkholderia sp. Ax-1724 TaxID=2608336 RepID=UPI00141D7E4A|nr:M23 family metallopeptidase [Burkholderia sp. Ax-1724]NIF55483.1 hypothetical protein [Burkholderia sp. Ax-1724]
MIISPPFLPTGVNNGHGPDDDDDPMMTAVNEFELAHGVYPIAVDRRWHTGIHLMPANKGDPVRAIADGEVVAYRISQKAIDGGSGALDSNTGFVLLKHRTETGDGRSITFYSLYMHLLDLDSYADAGATSVLQSLPGFLQSATPDEGAAGNSSLKVYRKDVLGVPGACHGQRHIHFEIFMLQNDFKDYFRNTKLGNAQPTTAVGNDCWGHTYFVIPAGQNFKKLPDGANPTTHTLNTIKFVPLQDGTNDTPLHVEAYFHRGNRYVKTWSVAQDGTRTLLTSQSVEENSFEYGMIHRAIKLYDNNPNNGYEQLRFGRILSDDPTPPVAATDTSTTSSTESLSSTAQLTNQLYAGSTWMRIAFSQDREGYIDINPSNIVKLSDADFSFVTGWQKISEETSPYSDDGMCDVDQLNKILADAAPVALDSKEYVDEDGLCQYVLGHDDVRSKLRGFICEAPTEWDKTGNSERYKRLNDPDGFYGKQQTNPDGYHDFLQLLEKFQFWDKTGISSEKLWFFHPLEFIRTFRRCGWLSQEEMARCFPPKWLYLQGTQFAQTTTRWSTANSRAHEWVLPFNKGTRKYGVSATRQRLAHFFAHVVPETGNLHSVKEIGGEHKHYNPYYGRGLIQLTLKENYEAYGKFRKFPTGNAPAQFSAIGWDPNALIARNNEGDHNCDNCVDSSCFYVANRAGMLGHMDAGVTQNDAAVVSGDVNGHVSIENLNGYDVRLQAILYMRKVLLDDVFPGNSIPLTFVWRRNSAKEPVLDEHGNPVPETTGHPPHVVMIGNPPHPKIKTKFYSTQHTITASLELQKP